MDELNRLKREIAQSQYEQEAKKRIIAAGILGLPLVAAPRNGFLSTNTGVSQQNGTNLNQGAMTGMAKLPPVQGMPSFATLPSSLSSNAATAVANQQMPTSAGMRQSMLSPTQNHDILQMLNNRASATAPSLSMSADLSGLATTATSQLRTDALLADFTAQSAADAAALRAMNASSLLRANQQEDAKLRAMILFNQIPVRNNNSEATQQNVQISGLAELTHPLSHQNAPAAGGTAWPHTLSTVESSLLERSSSTSQISSLRPNKISAATTCRNLQRPAVAFDPKQQEFLSSLQSTDGSQRNSPQSQAIATESSAQTKSMGSEKDPPIISTGTPHDHNVARGTGTAVAALKMPASESMAYGEFSPLGIEEDNNWLSEMHCFLRSEIVEVFQAEKSAKGSAKASPAKQQVGIRCRWCANIPSDLRAGRSSAFPSSLRQLYQSFTMMVRDHFGPTTMCQAIPVHLRERLNRLRCSRISQGASDSKHYWIYAAKKIGMLDTNRQGIKIAPESKAAGLKMPCFGSAEDTSTTDAESHCNKEQPPTVLLVQPSDIPSASMFLYTLLLQTQLVHLQPSEQVAKRKTLPIGLEGIGCRHCCAAGRFGFSRRFPLRRRCLSEEVKDIHSHMMRCPLCPKEVKQLLEKLHVQHETATVAGQNTKDGRGKDPHREFFDVLWARLGRVNDIKT